MAICHDYGRKGVMAMGEFCRNVVGPPEWECEDMGSVVWVKCATSGVRYLRKVDRFLGGLNQHLRSALCMLDFPDFQSLVNKALIAEREYKPVPDNRPANNDHKLKFEPKKDG